MKYWAAVRRHFRFGVILVLVALASGAIVYDRLAKPLDFTAPPIQGHTVDVTTSLPPR